MRCAAEALALTPSQPGRARGRPGRILPLGLVLAVVAVVVVVEVNAVGYAFSLAGLSPTWVVVVLMSSLLGSLVDVPVGRIGAHAPRVEYWMVPLLRGTFLVPVTRRSRGVRVAVNVGGAIVPTAVSAYLLARLDLWAPALAAVVVVALVVHLAARPVHGQGIAVPMFLPALAATGAALLVNPESGAPALAYVAGTLGTLVGGDLTHLGSVRRLGAESVSIGGAGTFDGIFLSGVLAVLLAAAAA